MIIESLTWLTATIVQIRDESPRTKTFRLKTLTPYAFIAGQHTIVRATLPNGFTASRDYSFSSAPSSGRLEITVTKALGGELSGWFHDTCQVGDSIEITLPLGSDFTWTPAIDGPTLLIAGGTGITPCMSILREHQSQNNSSLLKLVYSARNFDDVCFKSELLATKEYTCVLGVAAPGWDGPAGRLTAQILAPFTSGMKQIYVCGPYTFVAAIKSLLIDDLHISPAIIKIEQFN